VAGSVGAGAGLSADQGAVYVFRRPSGGWANIQQTAKLTASDGATDDRLGSVVAVSGDTVVGAAPRDDIGPTVDQGSVYVFEMPAGGWGDAQQTAKLTGSDQTPGGLFGSHLGVAGATVVVGVPLQFASDFDPGFVAVFERPSTGWVDTQESARLTASDRQHRDQLGASVAISGDTVVAGAPSDDVGPNLDQGSVYVFEKPASGWTDRQQTAKLTASDGAGDDHLGSLVAISGDTVIAGSGRQFVVDESIYVFDKPRAGWSSTRETVQLDAPPAEPLSGAIAIAGDTIAAGSPLNHMLDTEGRVYVFPRLPRLSVLDVEASEGNAGTTNVTVRIAVTAAAPSSSRLRVEFRTVDNTARALNDYVSASGTVEIAGDARGATISLGVVGDVVGEPDETFFVVLSAPENAALLDPQATITILNDDDAVPPVTDPKGDVRVESRTAPVRVLYTSPGATDNVDGKVPVTCSPPSGSSFPAGSTTVKCTATDKNGNTSTTTFEVKVEPPRTGGAVTNPGNLAKPLEQVAPGQRVRVTAGGFAPGTSVALLFLTAEEHIEELGRTEAGADGRIDASVKIPKRAPGGPGQVTARAAAAGGGEFVRAWVVTVRG
jgi:hypothetical protein